MNRSVSLRPPSDGVRVVCVYIPNGQEVGSDKYQYKLKWLAALQVWLKDELMKYPKLALLGDYNIAPEDRDVYDPVAWQGNVLVSEPERAAFQGLLHLGLRDAFRLFEQAGEKLLLVGLPHDGVPPQHGTAHRPHPHQRRICNAPRASSTRRHANWSGRPITLSWLRT